MTRTIVAVTLSAVTLVALVFAITQLPSERKSVREREIAPAAEPTPHVPDTSRSKPTRNAIYYISYVPSPDPIRLAQSFDLTITVLENADRTKPVTDASLSIQGWMPAHSHGMYTTPSITSNGDGTYGVRGMLFHMEMNWQIRVEVTRADVTDGAVFDVLCCNE